MISRVRPEQNVILASVSLDRGDKMYNDDGSFVNLTMTNGGLHSLRPFTVDSRYLGQYH